MRSMARPLAPAPTRQRGYDPYGYDQTVARRRDHSADMGRPELGRDREFARDHGRSVTRSFSVRQRRQNVLMSLATATTGSAFIAFTTKSDFFVYVFVFSAMALAGYCYRLSQMRRYSRAPQSYRRDWIRAA